MSNAKWTMYVCTCVTMIKKRSLVWEGVGGLGCWNDANTVLMYKILKKLKEV